MAPALIVNHHVKRHNDSSLAQPVAVDKDFWLNGPMSANAILSTREDILTHRYRCPREPRGPGIPHRHREESPIRSEEFAKSRYPLMTDLLDKMLAAKKSREDRSKMKLDDSPLAAPEKETSFITRLRSCSTVPSANRPLLTETIDDIFGGTVIDAHERARSNDSDDSLRQELDDLSPIYGDLHVAVEAGSSPSALLFSPPLGSAPSSELVFPTVQSPNRAAFAELPHLDVVERSSRSPSPLKPPVTQANKENFDPNVEFAVLEGILPSRRRVSPTETPEDQKSTIMTSASPDAPHKSSNASLSGSDSMSNSDADEVVTSNSESDHQPQMFLRVRDTFERAPRRLSNGIQAESPGSPLAGRSIRQRSPLQSGRRLELEPDEGDHASSQKRDRENLDPDKRRALRAVHSHHSLRHQASVASLRKMVSHMSLRQQASLQSLHSLSRQVSQAFSDCASDKTDKTNDSHARNARRLMRRSHRSLRHVAVVNSDSEGGSDDSL